MNELKIIICIILIFNILSIENINGMGDIKIIEKIICFSPPELKPYENIINISIKETKHQYIYPNHPILPIYILNYEFPFSTKIKNITFKPIFIENTSIYNNDINVIYPYKEFNKKFRTPSLAKTSWRRIPCI